MTDKFTLQEIERAYAETLSEAQRNGEPLQWLNIKAKLTKPRVEFAEGEVGFDPVCNDFFVVTADDLAQNKGIDECRKLTTTESGAGELIKALEVARADIEDYGENFPTGPIDRINEALDKWKGDRDE